MSILDTFFILFKSNAKETEKDFDALGKKTKQTQEDIDKTDKSTRQLGLTFDDFVKALVTASGIDFSIKGLASATKNVADMEVEPWSAIQAHGHRRGRYRCMGSGASTVRCTGGFI